MGHWFYGAKISGIPCEYPGSVARFILLQKLETQMNDIAREFWSRMEGAEQKLALIPEDQARKAYRPNGWLRKELLGHLVDSACVNHIRFAYAAANGSYEGPGYDQNAWVTLHGYASVPWAAILDQWRMRNTWLAEMVTNIPQEKLSAMCKVGDNPPMRLDDLIRDYLGHLEHHVEQLMTDS
jgi:DinB superfamily